MDETIGSRINVNRAEEALAQRPDLVTSACPYCLGMLADGLAAQPALAGDHPDIEVTDVAEVLLRSIGKRTSPSTAGGT